jgi:AbrB family looped-hinge helix DNA binding protein
MRAERADIAVMTTKGQLVIPARLRRKHGMRKGTRVAVVEEGSKLVLQPLNRQYFRSLRGMFRGETSLLEALLQERRKERVL